MTCRGHFDVLWDSSAGGKERGRVYRDMYPPVARAAINQLRESVSFCWPEGEPREYRHGQLGVDVWWPRVGSCSRGRSTTRRVHEPEFWLDEAAREEIRELGIGRLFSPHSFFLDGTTPWKDINWNPPSFRLLEYKAEARRIYRERGVGDRGERGMAERLGGRGQGCGRGGPDPDGPGRGGKGRRGRRLRRRRRGHGRRRRGGRDGWGGACAEAGEW
jgi:hypothetical protein